MGVLYMKTTSQLLSFIFVSLLPVTGMAGHHENLHTCLKKASDIKDGYYAKLEYLILTDKGTETYEIEIHDKDGIEWELRCDIQNGVIYEMEREVNSVSDPLFKRKMKVSEQEAGKIALELYPGKIVHTEYEIEENGNASYEFDIYNKPGITYKIEINATSGEIEEVSIEKWDIGRETEE